MASPGPQSALIVEVPEAEPAVRQHRERLDASAPAASRTEPGRFTALTERVAHAFPAFPPYEGQCDVVVPHLTVGHGHTVADLRQTEESVRVHLPIGAQATAVTLMTQQAGEGRWSRTATFPLAREQAQ